MGLDINVFKPKMPADVKEDDYTFFLDENPELEIFSEFAYDKVNTYYDLLGEVTKLGYKEEDLELISQVYGKSVLFNYRNKAHELYKVYELLDNIWHETYYDTKKKLMESDGYAQYLKYLPLLKKYGYRPLYKFYASGNKTTYYNLNRAYDFVRKKTEFTVKNPPIFDKVERCICCDEVGYQRKGANQQFYEDDMWGSKCVTKKNELIEHWEKYFSMNTPDSKGGWGSGTEMVFKDDEMKARFKENIVDKFVEGENFVIYN